MTDITIRFSNPDAARHFALWLCGSGKQSYWDWMRFREREGPGDMTAVHFGYHGPEDKTKAVSDPDRYGEFLCDGIIRAECGRLDE